MAAQDYLSGWDVERVGSMSIGLTASTGGHGLDTITFSTGTFSHVSMSSVMGGSAYQAFATAIQTAFNALGGGRPTLTVTYSATMMRYTFSVSAGTLAMSFTGVAGTRARQALGYSGDTAATASPIVSGYRPYYAIRSAVGGPSAYTDEYEDKDGIEQQMSDAGRPVTIARSVLAKFLDWEQMFEPKLAPSTHLSGGVPSPGAGVFTYPPCPSTEVPWTWEHMIQHLRGDDPFMLYDDTASTGIVCVLRGDGAYFDKGFVKQDYSAYFNIPFKTVLLGRL